MTFGEAKLLWVEPGLSKSRSLTTKILFVSLNSVLANSCLMAFRCARKTV